MNMNLNNGNDINNGRFARHRDKAKMKRKIIIAVVAFIIITIAVVFLNTASFKRFAKTTWSNWSGGINRTVNVYDYEGDLIATYTGKIDIEENDTKVLFDLDGKRYIYYNCLVEVIEETKN